ncbi:putative structural protein [Pseudomonas phage BroderSalsa]|nr:putative structural protein [Pseudomonas phage BroderSalsa]
MAGLLAYEGSELPESVRKAAQGALDYKKATQARIPLAMEGSGIPESVRKAAQRAIEAGPRTAPSGGLMGGWADGQKVITADQLKGALTKGGELTKTGAKALLKGLGPAAAAYEGVNELDNMFGPSKYGNISNIMEEGRTRKAMQDDPELSNRGAATVDRINAGAMEGVRGLMGQAREQNANQPPQAPEAPTGILPGQAQDQVQGVDPQADGSELAQAQEARKLEAARQQVKAGALEGLRSGEVSVSQMAKGVVEADEQRSGTSLNPEEKQKAITSEIQALKTMDKSQMAEYVSYALIAGGLLASVFDKSGEAGRMFHDSMNKQLDRNLAAGKMAASQKLAEQKAAREDRDLERKEKDTESNIKYRGLMGEQGERKLDQGDRGLDQGDTRISNQAAQAAASLGVQQQRNQITMRGQDMRASQAEAKLAAAKEKAATSDKGVPLSYKDSKEVVKDVYKSQGVDADSKLQGQIASRLPTLMKKYPQMSAQELVELAQGEVQVETEKGWFSDTTRIKKPKVE